MKRPPSLRPGARILFLTNTRIGDVVLSTGLLGLLTDSFPTARVTVVAGHDACSLFHGAPGVERVIPLRKQRYDVHWLSLYLSLLRPWDLVVDLRGSGLAWMVPTRHRRIINRSDPTEPRVVELGRLLDAHVPPAPRLWLQESDRQAATRLIPVSTDFLAVAPGAGNAEKQWPPDRFAAMINRLTERHGAGSALVVTLLGADDERPLVEAVSDRLRDRPHVERPIVVLGQSLPVVAAILERARIFVGNDSGLMHLAAASGAPTVGLFGPTPAARYRPWGERTLLVLPDGCLESDQPGPYPAPRPITDLQIEHVVACVTRFASRIGVAARIASGHCEPVC